LALVGAAGVLAPPPAPFLHCAADHPETTATKLSLAQAPECRVVAYDPFRLREALGEQGGLPEVSDDDLLRYQTRLEKHFDAGNMICAECYPLASVTQEDADGWHWKQKPLQAARFCLSVAPKATLEHRLGEPSPQEGVEDAYEGTIIGDYSVNGDAPGRIPGLLGLTGDGRYHIAGSRGDEYGVVMTATGLNHTGTQLPRKAAVYLAVDGINTLGQAVELPTRARRWLAQSGGRTVINGWQLDGDQGRWFKFVSLENSVAVRLGRTKNVGQITALVYLEKDGGCPDGPLCSGLDNDHCPVTDVTPPCRCYLKGEAEPVDCTEASKCRPCVKFVESCKCFDKSGRKRPACHPRKCYLEDGSRVPFGGRARCVKSHTVLKYLGSASGDGGGSVESAMATGEGRKFKQAIRSVELEMEPTPWAVLTIHYGK